MLDAFCMEITGTKKAPFNFEQELFNQAKAMAATSWSDQQNKLMMSHEEDWPN